MSDEQQGGQQEPQTKKEAMEQERENGEHTTVQGYKKPKGV